MRCLTAACACLVLLAAGCGGADGGSGSAGDAVPLLPEDAGFVLLISTDLQRYDDFTEKALERDLEDFLREGFRESGMSYDEDVEPLLGNDIVLGVRGELVVSEDEGAGGDRPLIAALDTDDAEKLAALAQDFPGVEPDGEVGGVSYYRVPFFEGDAIAAAVAGDLLVVGTSREVIEQALAQRESGLTQDDISERLADLAEEAPIRGFGNARELFELSELEDFAGFPWVEALETFGFSLDADGDEVRIDAVLNTDGDQLSDDDLPLATGDDAPEVLDRELEIAGGNRDQSRTTAFLLRAVRHAYPESRFVQEVDALERDLGIDFEEEILRQFDGPSVSAVSPDGTTFAARSDVSDPDALAAALEVIAPRLPQLVEGLQGLQSEGMALLFLFAPDTVALQELDGIQVEEPAAEGDLYRVSGLTGEGPSELHFGLVGDVFVVSSSEEAARAVAEENTIEAEGAVGGAVLRLRGEALRNATATPLGIGPASCVEAGLPEHLCRELVASVEASQDGLHARLRIKLSDEP